MSFVEDEHPRDSDGKFASKDDGGSSPDVSLVKDDVTGKYYDKLDKQREEIHGKDWEEFQDIFDKYPKLLKDSGGLPDTSQYNKDMVLEVEFQPDEFWKDDEWKKRDEKLKKLEDNPPKSFADLKYEESDKLYDVKDDKDNDKKVDKIRDELRKEKYDNIRPIKEWRYVNADKTLRKLEKEYEKTGDSYVKDRIDQQKEFLDYYEKEAEVERRIYNNEKSKLKNMLSDQENEKQVRIIGIDKVTDELVMSYHNFMTDKYEKLNQAKHDEKIEKLLKKNWNTINDDGTKGIDDYRMTYFAYHMEYGRIIDTYNDYMNKGDNFEPDEGEPTVEEIKTLYNNIPKKVTDFINAHSSAEKDYTDSIKNTGDIEDVKNDIKFNVVTPLMSEGYGISAVVDETRDYLYYPRKEAVESAVELLERRRNIDFWKGVTNKTFQTRLHGGKGPKFNVGNKTHREGGHWSKSANEIKIYDMTRYKTLDNILPHEFSHSQFEGVREYVKWTDSNMSVSDLNDNTKEEIKEMYDMFVGEVKNIKEGVESNDLSESIKKLPELEKDLKLESGVFGGGKPEKVFTDYFMDYVRARDDEDVKDRKKAKSIDTEMFACLSELKYSTKPEDRKKLFMIKLAYPKLFKSYEVMEGGIKGLPKDEITDKVEVGFSKVDDMRGVMNSVESKKKSYESIEYLNVNGEFVDEEEAEVVYIKEYDSDDQLIGMKSYSLDLKEVTEEAFDETKHTRGGNPENKGQFSKGSGGGSDAKKLKRQSKHEKPKFPSKPQNNPNVQTSLRFKMIEEVKKNFKNIDTDKLLNEAEKADNEWQSRENLGLKIDTDFSQVFKTSRVMHRTKDTFSSIEKLARKPDIYKSVDDLNDRTGVRVISNNLQEVREAIKYIEENYEIVKENDYLEGHTTGSGYRSYHCIIKDNETGFEAEIQVRTENQDIWANVFHDLYKPHEEKMKKALNSNPEGIKEYANKYSEYLYNIDCCQEYGSPPALPTELENAGFSYSKEAELDENDFFDAIIGEIYEMTPDYGYNVVIFDDYAPDGEKLTLIGNYESSEDANEIKLKCEEQGKITYIYMADEANEAFVEDEHPRDGDGKFSTKDGGDDTNKDFDTFKKELKEKIIPTAEENTKNAKVESSVINGINDYAKDKYDGKINFVETQGSFAKGTDLAGSSDLDIFVGFDYNVPLKDMENIVLELGDNVLKPISDEGKYKIMNGADKKYPESYVNGVEVQIIGTTDVTLDQIKNGMNNPKKGITDGMKTATDRSPHHTRFMKEALKGKEEDVRMVKKFFKDAGVYDASIAKQGFSGFSTEVLVHNLGSFDEVLDFFANFKKGSVVGETSRKFNTPLVMVDPIDENRNLASAFSHADEDSSVIPNKNLGRLIKTAQSVIKDGKLPEITSTEEDSVTMDFNIDNSIERNEVYSQLYRYANSTAKQFDSNDFGVKVAKDKVTEDFTVDMPRINVNYDEDTGKGSISFALNNFDLNTRLVGGIKKEGLPKHVMDKFYAKHEGRKIVEKDNKLYAEYEGQTASEFLNDIVNRKGKNMTKSSKLDKFLINSTITRGVKDFENLTDKPTMTESFVEDEHPRDEDGKFTSKDDGGLNSRVEQKQNVIQSQIDYLQKSMKPESQKYSAFQKVTDEDRKIRYNNKKLQEDIDKLKLELDSPDTTGLPHLPLKQNTHVVQEIEDGISWKEGVTEPLKGFKKGNSEINVSIPLERADDDYVYDKEKADRQLNTLKLMWNSLGDDERDNIKSFTIERTPKLIIEDKDGGGFVYKNMDDVATAGYWRPSENKLCMRVDYTFDDDQLKGTFTHEVGHSLWHSIKENNPERIEAWKTACKKIPPTTKYGKYNKKNWTGMKKMFDKYEKDGWSEFPEEERAKKRENAIKNVEFYEDRYYNELHSEVHMYMMGNNKYKRGTVTKGIEKFLEPYKALHGVN